MSDNTLARPRLERRDRLIFRRDAKHAGLTPAQVRPLLDHQKQANTVGRVLVDDFWFETVLNEQWAVAYRLVAQPEGLAVAEVRVFPNEPAWRASRTPPGEWSGVLRGTDATVPRGGLTARLLRQVRLDRSVWYCRELVEKMMQRLGKVDQPGHPAHGRSFVAYALHRGGVRSRTMQPTPHETQGGARGRPRLPTRDYMRLATAYKKLLLQGRRGKSLHQALASQLGLTVSRVTNRLARARKYGYLADVAMRGRISVSPDA